MRPIYKFQLTAGEDTQRAYPIYKDDLAIEYAQEQNEQFYRGKLSGKLTFESADFTFIKNKAFDTQFDIVISISYDCGQTWNTYWSGRFWKTDCDFDDDAKTCTVTPTLRDQYNDVLDGMEKEFNLIDLAPAVQQVNLKKRPCLQIYIPGNTSIGQVIFGNNTHWESECEAQQYEDLGTFHFDEIASQYPVEIIPYDTTIPDTGILLISTTPVGANTNINYGQWRLQITQNSIPGGGYEYDILLTRLADGAQWRDIGAPDYSLATLNAVEGTGADFQHIRYSTASSITVMGRIIMDKETEFVIDDTDMVANNRNYRYCLPFPEPNNALIVLSGNMVETPTSYGIYQPGIYYDLPDTTGHYVPIARNSWGRYSIWLNLDAFALLSEYDETFSTDVVLRDAYPIWSVISVILGQIAPGVTHNGRPAYSQFLYNTNPITEINTRLLITPKSNIITFGYEQPAQKSTITLKMITNMLRDCFRCYWFIDDEGRFRIEHIKWFMRGGTYTGNPVVGIDLTQEAVTRNGKKWAFARNQYSFDKPEMASRYQFGWMDRETELFDGAPIDIISGYVNLSSIEQINIAQFSSDIDFILLNPSEISKDGYALMAAVIDDGEYVLPFDNIEVDGVDHLLQNPYVAFEYLQWYYHYDLPATKYSYRGVEHTAMGIKKLKLQTLRFPALTEPNMTNLIKTNLGNGTIQKMSINLSSRNANTTLKYDTE